MRLIAGQFLWAAAAMALLASCTERQAPLNSDGIREQFGSYGVEILHADSRYRISNLYSGAGPGRTCRTLAIVEFAQPMTAELSSEHRRVAEGGSIGEVFREAGWSIHKINIGIANAPLPDITADIPALMKIDTPSSLATHSYRFEVEKNGNRHRYATITEIHHPDYLTPHELSAMYPGGI